MRVQNKFLMTRLQRGSHIGNAATSKRDQLEEASINQLKNQKDELLSRVEALEGQLFIEKANGDQLRNMIQAQMIKDQKSKKGICETEASSGQAQQLKQDNLKMAKFLKVMKDKLDKSSQVISRLKHDNSGLKAQVDSLQGPK